MADITERLNTLEEKRGDLLEQREKINADIALTKSRFTAAVLDGQEINPAELQGLEAQGAAVDSAINGLINEILKCENELNEKKRDELHARMIDYEKQADALFLKAAAAIKNCIDDLRELERLRIKARRLGIGESIPIKSKTLKNQFNNISAELVKVLARLAPYSRDVQRIFEETRKTRA